MAHYSWGVRIQRRLGDPPTLVLDKDIYVYLVYPPNPEWTHAVLLKKSRSSQKHMSAIPVASSRGVRSPMRNNPLEYPAICLPRYTYPPYEQTDTIGRVR